MSGVNDALAAARRPAPPPQPAPQRRAFILGNTGKLGEELLSVLLEGHGYASVQVGVRKAVRSYVPRLEPVVVPRDRSAWDPCAGMKVVPEDIYLCIEPEASFWKLAKPYVALTSAQAATVACRMRAAGARRVAVVTPLEAILQMGMAPAIANTDELAIANAGFERMLVLRPTQAQEGNDEEGAVQAVGSTVIRVLASVMMPKSLQPVRARHVARLAVDTLATMADGVQVIGAARLRELVGDPLG